MLVEQSVCLNSIIVRKFIYRKTKNHEVIESISIREEVEQQLINESVNVEIENNVTYASLPFIYVTVVR